MNGRDDCGKEQHKTDGAGQELLPVGQVVTIPVDQLASANKNNAPQCLEREFCSISLQNAHRKVWRKLDCDHFDNLTTDLQQLATRLPVGSGKFFCFFYSRKLKKRKEKKKRIRLQARFIPGPTAPRRRWGWRRAGWCLGGLWIRRQSRRSRSAWPSGRRSSAGTETQQWCLTQPFKSGTFRRQSLFWGDSCWFFFFYV